MDTENEEASGSVEDDDLSFNEESDFERQYDHAISALHGTNPEASDAKPVQTSQSSRLRSCHRKPAVTRALGYHPVLGQYNDTCRQLLNEAIFEATEMTFDE